MGKWVVCAKHPSNEFFEQFPNCLTFRNEGIRNYFILYTLLYTARWSDVMRLLAPIAVFLTEEFAANVFWALNNPPQMLTREQRYTLSWDAAMERYLYHFLSYV